MAPLEDIREACQAEIVTIRYRNYRGEVSDRNITPRSIRFGHTEWHPDNQWLLEVFDHDKWDERSFAMKDILSWRAYGRETGDV